MLCIFNPLAIIDAIMGMSVGSRSNEKKIVKRAEKGSVDQVYGVEVFI